MTVFQDAFVSFSAAICHESKKCNWSIPWYTFEVWKNKTLKRTDPIKIIDQH